LEQERLLLEELLKRKRARQHLIDFVIYINPRYQVAWFHREIAAKLEAVERGEILRLLITMPPRHGKSQLATIYFIAWYFGKHPDRDVISASFGSDLALDFSRQIREVVRSQEYQNVFPGVRLAEDSQANNRWHVVGTHPEDGRPARGGFVAAGAETAITGRGAHLLNLDDMMKNRTEAESEVTRKSRWSWYTSTASTRLMPRGAVVATMTRWHEEDLIGCILARAAEEGAEKWTHINYPATDNAAGLPLLGNALWPEWYPNEVLEQKRRDSEYDWWALFMQSPRPPGGSFFTEASLLEDGQPVIPIDDYGNQGTLDYIVPVIDTALKTGKDHDGCAVTYMGVARHGQCRYQCYILDWDYKQIDGALLVNWLPTVFERGEELVKEYKARYGLAQAQIEDKGSGTVLIQQAANMQLPAMAIESGLTAMGKAERAFDVSNYVFAGNCKFTPYAYNKVVTFKGITKNHLLAQILNFRAGTQETAADDLLDTWTYALALVIGNYLGF
jgi:phage terminase large subunit-like protein